jgi:hypothetical protein
MEGLYNYPWTSEGKPEAKEEISFFVEEEEFPETGI